MFGVGFPKAVNLPLSGFLWLLFIEDLRMSVLFGGLTVTAFLDLKASNGNKPTQPSAPDRPDPDESDDDSSSSSSSTPSDEEQGQSKARSKGQGGDHK